MVITDLLAYVTPLAFADFVERRILSNYPTTLKFLTKVNSRALETLSKRKAQRMFQLAQRNVPAYQKVAAKAVMFADAPITTKRNYINKFSHEQRCVHGMLPQHGNIDESAGSSGKPTQWVRSYEEELMLQRLVHFEYEYMLKAKTRKRQFLVISAWSSGPWATGIKFCEIMEHFSVVKETSTDMNNIIETMKTFKNKYAYLIAGYPAFLRLLFEQKFQWKKYDIHVLTGGEGVSIGLENYLKAILRKGATIISSYGCSDIDIGIGIETPLAKFIRAKAHTNLSLRQTLFGNIEETPMVFQYNPLVHYIENIKQNGKQEFLVTTLDKNTASPKVRYSLRDVGGAISFNKMHDALRLHFGKNFLDKHKEVLHLPFLWVSGRNDGTLSFDGANVSPKNVEEAIFSSKFLAQKINHFMISKGVGKNHRVIFRIYIELKQSAKPSSALQKRIHDQLLSQLVKLNSDFAESLKNNTTLNPVVRLHTFGHGPFAGDSAIKLKYIT